MSNFTNDNSAQLSYTPSISFSYNTISTPDVNFNGTSGIYNPVNNVIKMFTNNIDALTIDSTQCLYGNGTGLTNIGYNNIINKPNNFPSDWLTTVSNRPDLTVYGTNTNLYSLSTNSTLSINNINATSTTTFNNLNSLSTNSILSINNLNSTSTTTFNNLNSLSTNSILNINRLNATSTTIFNNLNSLSTNSILSINNLNATSTTTFNNLNSLSTNSILSINNLNSTSTTTFNNLNSFSTNSRLLINNLNATSTTIFTNLNSLSTNSTLSINNLNATSTTIFANLTTSNSVFITAINNLGATSTTIFNNLNSLSSGSTLSITNLNNKTNFTNLLVTGASTINSSLNITGVIINTSTTASEFKAMQIAHAARISHIPYSDGIIYLRAPVIIDNSADYLSFGARTGDFIIKLFGEDYGFGINGYTLRYNAALAASHKFYTGSTLTFTISDTGNITSIGSCTATSFIGSGANLTNLPLSAYSTTGNDANYLLKTGGVMTGQITGITTVNGTTGIFSTVSTTNNGNANTPQLGVFGGTGDRFILYVGTAALYPYSLGINSDVLWYSVPATASHIFYVGGSPKATISSTGLSTTGTINASTNLQEAGVNLTSKYLKLDGTNTMSGGLKFNNIISTKVISLYDASPANNFQFVGFGNNNGLCINTYQENDAFQFKVGTTSTTSKEVMRIQGNGKVGIGTNDPKTLLHLRGAKPATLKIETNNSDIGEVCCIEFGIPAFLSSRCAKIISTTYGGDKADIQFLTSGNAGTTDSSVRMTIKEDGNIGIGTDTPRSLLHIKGTSPALTIMAQGGTGATTQLNLSTYDHTTNAPNCSLIATDNGTFGATFQIKQKTSGANANAQFTSLSIDASGTVNIVNTLQVAGNDINNFLFNNTGRNHSIYQDFNAIDKFGYTYMWTGTNGPGTASSYYSWYIGLGNEYPFANSVNGYYGMQFAVGRSETYPKLSVRRKENNVWTGWEGLTAERAVSLTSGDKTISGSLDITGQAMIGGLRVNGGDTNTLYNYGRDLGLLVNTGQSINFNMWGGNGNIMTVNNSGVVIDVDGVPITIDNKGIIIGTFTNHYYPLVVNRTINGTLSYVYVRTGWNGGGDYNTNSYTADISCAFAGAIHVSANILNSSDIRIKKEINDINDDGALQQILAIEPKTYKYIDYLSKGNSTVYGFIAQQVKEVIPHAVEFVKDIIPNIYKRATCSSNIITLENDVSQELNINDNIKIYDEFGNDDMYNITEINENTIKIDKDINTSNVFVFGKEIDDFHTLKKDYIFTLNVCATQELYKLIQKQNEVIENLQLQINELKNNNLN